MAEPFSEERRSSGDYFPGITSNCPICGKEFYIYNYGDWAYKRLVNNRKKTFCSWTCVREFDKREEEERKKLDAKRKNHFRGTRLVHRVKNDG